MRTLSIGFLICFVFCNVVVFGQARGSLQPQLPPDSAALRRSNPLRNAADTVPAAVPTRGAVQLASGEEIAPSQNTTATQKQSMEDFPQFGNGGSMLTDDFGDETKVESKPVVNKPTANTSILEAAPFGNAVESKPAQNPAVTSTTPATTSPFAETQHSTAPEPAAFSPFENVTQTPVAVPQSETPFPTSITTNDVPQLAQQPTSNTATDNSITNSPSLVPLQTPVAARSLFDNAPSSALPVTPVAPEPQIASSRETTRSPSTVNANITNNTTNAANNPNTAGTNFVNGTGLPGPAKIAGPQTPQLLLLKQYPEEIQVDQPAALRTVVKNVGKTTAEEVTLFDQIPQGARLIAANPAADETQGADMLWELGTIEPGGERVIELQIVPLREGELGNVARILFASNVSGKTVVTKPMLKVEVKTPPNTMLGDTVNLEIVLSNPGSGTATGIELEEFVPDGLYHKDGKQLVNKIGKLQPKETKKLTLPLKCVGAGDVVNRLIVRANGNLSVEEKTPIQVLAPILKLDVAGAKTRYLERNAVYKLSVSNPGTAAAADVELVCQLPTSMKFVKTNQSGVYETSTHTVHWALEELPAGEEGEIELVTLPVKAGGQAMKFSGVGRNGLKSETTHDVIVDGLASVSFSVKCLTDLVEVGRDTTYEVNVVNRGTKESTNIVVGVQLSKGMAFVNADGPAKHKAADGIVEFTALPSLDAKQEKTYRVTARCLDDGDHRISVKLISDELQAPITKEESTRVIQ
ncbi:MAG: DUF11 domain-containing protein [Planctomycetaceae bacterium]|jgi:uncharacterized repeat protein (TIGR01451 family)|nr:DUF11 domain-containing protein [Planctomycetaceae bacterium]